MRHASIACFAVRMIRTQCAISNFLCHFKMFGEDNSVFGLNCVSVLYCQHIVTCVVEKKYPYVWYCIKVFCTCVLPTKSYYLNRILQIPNLTSTASSISSTRFTLYSNKCASRTASDSHPRDFGPIPIGIVGVQMGFLEVFGDLGATYSL